MKSTAAFWIIFGVTGALSGFCAVSSRSGDAMGRALAFFYAVGGAVCLGLALLVFFLGHGTGARLGAAALAFLPILVVGLMAAKARFGYLVRDYLKSPGHVFESARARGLGEAIERSDLAGIRRLAAAGADLNELGKDGRSALSFALDKKKLESAGVLLELGADPARGQGEAGRPPLVELVQADELEGLLTTALARGADANFVDQWKVPLLYSAIASRAMKNVERLVLGGARLDTRDDQLPSPLSYAIQRRLWPYAQFLAEHGAPLREAPGFNGLDAILTNVEPPSEGDPDRADYLALMKALKR
jgi:hypothetical protein